MSGPVDDEHPRSSGPPVEMPALHHAADRTSTAGQRRSLRLKAGQLTLLALASFSTVLVWSIGEVNLAAIGGAAAVVFAGVLRVQAKITDPKRLWYQGRAGAESAKTLAWRYAVGGDPFPVSLQGRDVDALYIERLREILTDLEGLSVREAGDGEEITGWMRETRRLPLSQRRDVYEHRRIADQRAWYSSKAALNGRRSDAFGVILLTFEAVAIIQALLKATGLIDVDLLAFGATVIAGVVAWVETKDFDTLESAYAVAARELAAINALIRYQDTEEEWANFVSNAEDSISREHTLWRASRT